MLETAKRISLTNYRLLIQGETGTGKEVLAQAIHNNSSRSQYPFVKLNLSAMSEEQAFEELKGDAVLKRVGRGTLYLDGIETLTKGLQREVMRILDSNPDIRFTASSGENLYALCQAGQFQKELFYRINEVSLETLPLRKRPEDIPMLFEYFLRNIYSNPTLTWGELFSEVLCQRLMEYRWPGNGKEVENLCKYFYCVKTDRKLTSRDLPPYILSQLAEKQGKLSPMDRELLLAISQNPKAGRARLYQILKEKGIEVTEGKVRGMLISLADRDLIKMNRTRGGCEITEDGEILSQSYLSFR